MTKEAKSNLTFLKELAENGELSPVMDREYRLEQLVEAHKYVETGRKRGNISVIIE